MGGRTNASDEEAKLRGYADALADGIESALPGWVERSVATLMNAWVGHVPPDVAEDAAIAGRSAASETGRRVRELLATDVDEQPTGPLALVRGAVRWPTAVLARAGMPPLRRDPFAEQAFPDDVYDLVPASFADLDPSLTEPGIAWGAAKAHIVLGRRRAEGKR